MMITQNLLALLLTHLRLRIHGVLLMLVEVGEVGIYGVFLPAGVSRRVLVEVTALFSDSVAILLARLR